MLNRRDFLASLAAATGGLLLSPTLRGDDQTTGASGDPSEGPSADPSAGTSGGPSGGDKLGPLLPQRRLGATGASVTMLGLGGAHVGMMPLEQAQPTIEAAIEGGIRFFDTAENYQGGESERRYGRWLVPKYREHIFLMSKSDARDAATARKHLDNSLQRLGTDRLDLWQIHAVGSAQEVDQRLADGVLDVMLEARAQGKTRFIGFTGHRTPQAHQRMLERTDVLQTCQMPVNVLDPSYLSFIDGVLPTLLERQMGVLAMKSLAMGWFLRRVKRQGTGEARAPVVPERVSLREALYFAWSLPVSVLISGVDSAAQIRENIELARSFSALTAEERAALVTRAADLAGPDVEHYKARG